jgi:hypothetical protein
VLAYTARSTNLPPAAGRKGVPVTPGAAKFGIPWIIPDFGWNSFDFLWIRGLFSLDFLGFPWILSSET